MKLGLFLPRPTAFYETLFEAMKRGFEAEGADVVGGTRLLDGPEIIEFCSAHRPQAIMEMNRCRDDIPDIPRGVHHIAWIVDLGGRHIDDFRGSEVLYFFNGYWLKDYGVSNINGVVDWLPPGTCEQTYHPESRSPDVEFSFVGHIPSPWSDAESARIVFQHGDRVYRFHELYEEIAQRFAGSRPLNLPKDGYVDVAKQLVRERFGQEPVIADRRLRYDIGVRTTRLMNRTEMVDIVLSSSRSLKLHGPDNWTQWERFRPYYSGFLSAPRDIRRTYQNSMGTLHEGVGPHFRVFDCMASGGCVFKRFVETDEVAGGMDSLFEPGVHYVPFDGASIEEQRQRLRNDQERRSICESAARLVRGKHTWRHRAKKILDDLKWLEA